MEEEWEAIEQITLDKLLDSMPNRVEAVISADAKPGIGTNQVNRLEYGLFQRREILALRVPVQKIGTTNKPQPIRLQGQGQLSQLVNLAKPEQTAVICMILHGSEMVGLNPPPLHLKSCQESQHELRGGLKAADIIPRLRALYGTSEAEGRLFDKFTCASSGSEPLAAKRSGKRTSSLISLQVTSGGAISILC
ncbi:hypothetical protein L873DRAFT_1793721 [Choiromyces venosus 120613-1]|uniref:Uncharacterized protein n=1 Tax=Choiromyces venosus 120613-1 TaxID=1336337 RepID=A0A3N4JA04_9PEZI|nr:hypothetical protein L873DRAFT_1793721 [Choiromyces venosus 120613-1]